MLLRPSYVLVETVQLEKEHSGNVGTEFTLEKIVGVSIKRDHRCCVQQRAWQNLNKSALRRRPDNTTFGDKETIIVQELMRYILYRMGD